MIITAIFIIKKLVKVRLLDMSIGLKAGNIFVIASPIGGGFWEFLLGEKLRNPIGVHQSRARNCWSA